ncbi:MAG: hypothetical protein WC499_00975 [Patescibacteria group bacterium]
MKNDKIKLDEVLKRLEEILEELEISHTLQPGGVITAIVCLKTLEIPFMSIFRTATVGEKAVIGVELQCGLLGGETDQLKKKLHELFDLPVFKIDGTRWMRIGLTSEPVHIIVGALIYSAKDGIFSHDYLKERIEKVFELTIKYWPLKN